MPVSLICETCHKSFSVPPSLVGKRRFCSQECSRKTETKVCPQCGITYTKPFSLIKRNGGKFCTQECYFEFKRSKTYWLEVPCEHCGIIVRKRNRLQREGERHYCSRQCAAADRSVKQEATCLRCGNTFMYRPNHQSGKYCSKTCADESRRVHLSCEWCGKDITRSKYQGQRHTMAFCCNHHQLLWNMKEGNLERDTSIEVLVRGELEWFKVPYEAQLSIGGFFPDFVIPHTRVIIEVDGDYFHANPAKYSPSALTELQVKNRKRDEQKELVYTNEGYSVLRLWESDIRLDVGRVIRRLLPILRGGINDAEHVDGTDAI